MPTTRRIFVSYRRDDSAGHAGRLADTLRALGAGEIFLDADTIALGENFVQRIHREIELCDLVLVLIGRNWLAPTGSDGRPRIFSARDFVHLEVKAALDRSIPVVPVLVDGAQMPEPEELPEALQNLAYRHGTDIEHRSWSSDVERLVRHLPPVDAPAADAPAHPSSAEAAWASSAATAGSEAAPRRRPDLDSGITAERADESPASGIPGRSRRNTRGTDVVVVAAKGAYGEYLATSSYVCQADRPFREGTNRMGFYTRKAIQPEFPLILHRRDHVLFTLVNADRLRARGEAFDEDIAGLIELSLDPRRDVDFTRYDGVRYQVLCLSAPADQQTLRLAQPIAELGHTAWTQYQRYLSTAQLMAQPRTTAELSPPDSDAGAGRSEEL